MPTLFEKIYGAVAASECAGAMAAMTEGWHWKDIDDKLGYIDDFIEHEHEERYRKVDWGPDWHRKAYTHNRGMTEDGVERQRMCATAIIEKGGRIDVWDFARVWVRDLDPDKFGYHLGNQDQIIYYMLKAGMPPTETGRYAHWQGWSGTGKTMLPIGIINAGDPRQAALDVYDVGRYRDVAHMAFNFGLECAAATQAAVAEALRPNATKEGVTQVMLSYLSETPKKDVLWAMEQADRYPDTQELRKVFHEKYQGRPISNVVEVISEAWSMIKACDWDPKKICLAAANQGRDGECAGVYANSVVGAFTGVQALPREWIETVDNATLNDPYTMTQRTTKETAEGLYQALQNELAKVKERIHELESIIKEPVLG